MHEIELELKKLYNELNIKEFDSLLPDDMEIRLSKRFKRIGGKISCKKKLIQISYSHLMEFGIEEVIEILRHEMAHQLNFELGINYKDKSYDFENTCSTLDVTTHCKALTKKFNWMYKCKYCNYILKKVRDNNKSYSCPKCHPNIYNEDFKLIKLKISR